MRYPIEPVAPELTTQPTPEQQRAQDATVAILRRYCDEAEAYLRARVDSARDASLDALCGCGIAASQCRCPLWSASHAGAR